MEEQIVSFDTAKLAEEKGFDVSGVNIYDNKELICDVEFKNWNNGTLCLLAPTQSLLQKWLRETHQLFVEVNIEMIVRGQEIFYVSIFSNDKREIDDFGITRMRKITGYKNYEEALEQGLQKALKLIPQAKQKWKIK